MQRNTRSLVKRGFAERQRLSVPPGEILGKMHAIIGAYGLLAEDVHPVMIKGAALNQLLDTVMSDHAITDHDQRLQLVQRGNNGVHK